MDCDAGAGRKCECGARVDCDGESEVRIANAIIGKRMNGRMEKDPRCQEEARLGIEREVSGGLSPRAALRSAEDSLDLGSLPVSAKGIAEAVYDRIVGASA